MLFWLSLWFLPPLLAFAFALCLPGKRSLIASALFIGIPLAAFSFWVERDLARPDVEDRFGFGAFISLELNNLTIGFAVALLSRALTLWARATVFPRPTLIYLTGFFAAVAVPAAPLAADMWRSWKNRPVTGDCASAINRIKVGDSIFRIPTDSRIATIYLSSKIERDALYVSFANDHRRKLCALSHDGRAIVDAADIAFKFNQHRPLNPKPEFCVAGSMSGQAGDICADRAAREGLNGLDVSALPLEAHIFDPAKANVGAFGGRLSTAADCDSRRVDADEVCLRAGASRGNAPLTLICKRWQTNWWCKGAYRWRPDAHLYFEFAPDAEEVVEGVIAIGESADKALQQFLGATIADP